MASTTSAIDDARPASSRFPGPRLMRQSEVLEVVGISRGTLYKWLKDDGNDFPRPVRIAPNMRRWVVDQVVEWVEARIAGAEDAA